MSIKNIKLHLRAAGLMYEFMEVTVDFDPIKGAFVSEQLIDLKNQIQSAFEDYRKGVPTNLPVVEVGNKLPASKPVYNDEGVVNTGILVPKAYMLVKGPKDDPEVKKVKQRILKEAAPNAKGYLVAKPVDGKWYICILPDKRSAQVQAPVIQNDDDDINW